MGKIVILGAGRVGASTAFALAQEKNDITLVDIDPEALSAVGDHLDIGTHLGNAAHPGVLTAAGGEDADLVLAVTQSDEVNMVACQIAHTMFNTPTKIARIRARGYLDHREIFNKDAIPIDHVISPEHIVTTRILRLIEHPGALQVLDFANGKIQLVGISSDATSPLVGHEIKDLRVHLPDIDSRVAAIYRRGRPIAPEGSTVIEPGDEVFFISATEFIPAVMRELHEEQQPNKRIMIAGAGNIGYRLAETLEKKKKYRIKVIERDPERANNVSVMLDDTIVLNGDAADENMLREENIDSIDVFCALTNDDEANILSAMLAKRLGARFVIAIVNRPAYADLIENTENTGVDIAIAPRTATVGSVLTYIRRGDMVAVHSLRNGAAEAIEAVAHGDPTQSKVVGRTIGELKLPSGTKIGAILRDEEVLIAHDDTIIESEDHVILFVVDKAKIPAVEKLFQPAPTFL